MPELRSITQEYFLIKQMGANYNVLEGRVKRYVASLRKIPLSESHNMAQTIINDIFDGVQEAYVLTFNEYANKSCVYIIVPQARDLIISATYTALTMDNYIVHAYLNDAPIGTVVKSWEDHEYKPKTLPNKVDEVIHRLKFK